MKSTLLFIFTLSILTGNNLLAKEETLATITNDENTQVFTFIAKTNEVDNTIASFYKDNYQDGKKISREELKVTELTQEGVVLDQRGDNTVINLKSENFDTKRGGDVVIDTLYNGINGERKEYDVTLAQSKTGWALFSANHVVTKLHIEVNKKMFIGSIGVKNIKME